MSSLSTNQNDIPMTVANPTPNPSQFEPELSENKLSWFNVPEQSKKLLISAASHWEDTAQSQEYINQALATAEESTDVLIAVYRYFFYKNNCPLALQVAEKVVAQVRFSEQLPEDWEQLKPILINRQDEPQIRLFLNAYAASGLVLAKLGKIENAKEIASRIKEIDTKNEFGASVLFDILTHPDEDDD